jgi:glycosyltransferase involved in cell wall biosynthesis
MDSARQPVLSVIIPCLNAEETIGAQLEALSREEWDEAWEAIVSDNGSTDRSRAVVESFAGKVPGLRIVDSSDRRGPAHAMNIGARAAHGERLAFCDADDVVAPGWVAAMGRALAEHDFVSSRLNSKQLNAPWVQEVRTEPPDGQLPVSWHPPHLPFTGAGAIGVAKALHASAGGFDESLSALFELDYSFRLQMRGVTLVLVPEATIYYRWRNSLGGIYRQAHWYARNSALLQKRYRPESERSPGLARWLITKWKPIVLQIPHVVRKGGRARMAWLLGWQFGRYRGSIEHRVLAL